MNSPSDAEFKVQLASIHAAEQRVAAVEAETERRLANAWFMDDPQEEAFPRRRVASKYSRLDACAAALDTLGKRVDAAEARTDPPVSEAQRRAMRAAAAGKSNLGISKSVGEEFSGADPGGKLPETKKDSAADDKRVIKEAEAAIRRLEESRRGQHGEVYRNATEAIARHQRTIDQIKGDL